MSVVRELNLAFLSPSKNSVAKYFCDASFSTYSLFSVDFSVARLSNSNPCSAPPSYTAAIFCRRFPPAPVTTIAVYLNLEMYWVSEICYFLWQSISSLSSRKILNIACAISSRLCMISGMRAIRPKLSCFGSVVPQVSIIWSLVSISGVQWDKKRILHDLVIFRPSIFILFYLLGLRQVTP